MFVDYLTYFHFAAPRPCTSDEFKCGNSQCIRKERFCDGIYDCKDRSDEPEHCTISRKPTCQPGYFGCNDGECIHFSWKCDGDPDCASGEDEANCKCFWSLKNAPASAQFIKDVGDRM